MISVAPVALAVRSLMNRKLALPGSTWSQPIVVSVFPASLAATRIFASGPQMSIFRSLRSM